MAKLILLLSQIDLSNHPEETTLSSLDRASLKRFQNGDEKGFSEIFDRHHSKVYRLCYSFLRNKEIAEELTQDVFLKFLKSTPGFNFKFAPSTIIYRITKQLCIDTLRRPGFHRNVIIEQNNLESFSGNYSDQESNIMEKELRELIDAGLNECAPEVRQVFYFKQNKELNFDTIASLLGISTRTAKRYLRKALDEIEKKMKANGFHMEVLS